MRNRERAARADAVLNRCAEESECDPGATALADLLADAMHLLGREAVLDSVRRAEAHHQAELEEEGGAS
jgi:hypothetical protein